MRFDSAIEAGGSSLKDFTDIQGNSGYFQFEFYVYGRENECCKIKNCAAKSKEFLSLEGLLSIVQAAKDNLNPENFTIKMEMFKITMGR